MHVSVAGAGFLLSQQAGTPRPLEWWGAASRQSWPWNGRGFSKGDGTLRDPSSSPKFFLQRNWGDAKAEGDALEGRAAFGSEEKEDAVARSYQDTVLSGKLRQSVRRSTNREGGGCLLPDDQCTKTGRQVAEVLKEKHRYMRVPPVENPTCAAFEGHACTGASP